jgi:hypothetical protein
LKTSMEKILDFLEGNFSFLFQDRFSFVTRFQKHQSCFGKQLFVHFFKVILFYKISQTWNRRSRWNQDAFSLSRYPVQDVFWRRREHRSRLTCLISK